MSLKLNSVFLGQIDLEAFIPVLHFEVQVIHVDSEFLI